MADTKVTDLTELTSPESTDLLMIVDDPGGTPVSKKIEVGNVLGALVAYGDIYVTGGSVAQSLTAATPVKLTLWTADGPSSNTTPDHTSDDITVGIAGVYRIGAQFSMTSSVNNATLTFEIAIGGVVQGVKTQRKIGTGADVGSCSLTGHLSLSASDVISIYVESDINTNLTLTEAQLVLGRIG